LSRKYSKLDVFQSFTEFYNETGEQPTFNRWKAEHRTPSYQTITRIFGEFNNALVEAGFETRTAYGSGMYTSDWDENEHFLSLLRNGNTLTELAAQLDITGQSLGRRLRRHCEVAGVEYPKLRRGPRKRDGT
jgi:hypothetical protein